MWGPLKDTGKEGFSVRRQAEKQQPVYRLILLCAPNLVAASYEAPPLSFSSVSAPHTPPPSHPPCLTFLAATSCMGAFPEQKQICLVHCHFLSLDPCLFFIMSESWTEGLWWEEECSHSSVYVLVHSALHRTCFVSPVPFTILWQTFNIMVTRDIFSLVQFLKDFLACFWGSFEWVIYSGMEPRVIHSSSLMLSWRTRVLSRVDRQGEMAWQLQRFLSRNMTWLHFMLHFQSLLKCVIF